MAITQVGSATAGSVNNGSSFSISKPTGVASGDVLILAITQNENTPTPVPTYGFTLIREVTAGETTNTWSAHIYYRVAGGSEPSSYTVSHNGDTSAPFAGVLSAWRGVDTAAPINVSAESASAGVAETSPVPTGPTVTTTANTRRIAVRATRNQTDPAVTFSSSTTGWSELAEAAGTSTGSVRYSVCQYARTADDTAGSGLTTAAITASQTETDNGWFHVALKVLGEPSSGAITSQVPSVTSAFSGSRVMPDGPLDADVPLVSAEFAGTAAPPSGTLDTVLVPVSASLAGGGIGGAFAGTTPSLTSQFEGGVEPIGSFAGTLAPLTSEFGGETQPFGENVIAVEVEHRAFLVIDDGAEVGIKPIKRTQVTDS